MIKREALNGVPPKPYDWAKDNGHYIPRFIDVPFIVRQADNKIENAAASNPLKFTKYSWLGFASIASMIADGGVYAANAIPIKNQTLASELVGPYIIENRFNILMGSIIATVAFSWLDVRKVDSQL